MPANRRFKAVDDQSGKWVLAKVRVAQGRTTVATIVGIAISTATELELAIWRGRPDMN